jgi:hypothetical protein
LQCEAVQSLGVVGNSMMFRDRWRSPDLDAWPC